MVCQQTGTTIWLKIPFGVKYLVSSLLLTLLTTTLREERNRMLVWMVYLLKRNEILVNTKTTLIDLGRFSLKRLNRDIHTTNSLHLMTLLVIIIIFTEVLITMMLSTQY